MTTETKLPLLLLVYGTLKGMTGTGKNFLKMAKTFDDFILYNGGFPSVRPVSDDENAPHGRIIGELFEITDENTLRSLDNYEGHPDLFERQVIKVVDDDGEEHEAWMYLGPVDTRRARAGSELTPQDGEIIWPFSRSSV